MLRRLTPKERIALFVENWEPVIRASFIDAVNSIRSAISIKLLVERLERGDVSGAVDALRIEPAAFREFKDALVEAFNEGGQGAMDGLPAIGVSWFDHHDAEASAVIAAHAVVVVDRVVEDAKAGIAQQIIGWLSIGLAANTIAHRVAGNRSRANGIRVGGLIGLTAQQMESAEAARTELQSGDPKQIAAYFQRKMRAKRFDRPVREAVSAGKTVKSADVSRLVMLYQANQFQMRATIFGRTQAMQSVNLGIATAIRQALQRQNISPNRLIKTWHSQRDDRVRHTHQSLAGNQVPFDGHFISDSGSILRFPGDPQAPTYETANCRCHLTYTLARD